MLVNSITVSHARSMMYVFRGAQILLLISIYLQLEFVQLVSDAWTLGIKCHDEKRHHNRHSLLLYLQMTEGD